MSRSCVHEALVERDEAVDDVNLESCFNIAHMNMRRLPSLDFTQYILSQDVQFNFKMQTTLISHK